MELTIDIKSKKSLRAKDIYDRSKLLSSIRNELDDATNTLAASTPRDRGVTASSWKYKIKENQNGITMSIDNSAKGSNNVPLVPLIRYGHGTRTGGYVPPRDFISPVENQLIEDIATAIEQGLKHG